ncbi:MAG: hypothetical protein ACO1OQ_16280, partial [Rufibacter sp.]
MKLFLPLQLLFRLLLRAVPPQKACVLGVIGWGILYSGSCWGQTSERYQWKNVQINGGGFVT